MSRDGGDFEMSDASLLSFFLGPVQTFIESARTVRDLWTGSYLLSWLAFHAMAPLLDLDPTGASLVFPALEGVPLFEFRPDQDRPAQGPNGKPLLMPCLPNKFVAVIQGDPVGDKARELAAQCKGRLLKAWKSLACDTHKYVNQFMTKALDPAQQAERWDRYWEPQVADFFEVRTSVLPLSSCDVGRLDELLGNDPNPYQHSEADRLWTRRLQLLDRLTESQRSIRHVPSYPLNMRGPREKAPQKCSLLGSYEQMGPAKLEDSREFWREVAATIPPKGILGENEKLCAISLIKRFAWHAHLAKELKINRDERRFGDTATVAAADWLLVEPKLDPDRVWDEVGNWSGQWLHWKSRNEGADDGEPSVPTEVWNAIEEKRKPGAQGAAPTYYAVLVMDGDHMGRWLRGEKCRESGHELQGEISKRLSHFAVNEAMQIVETLHHGTLIYAGGDDVLALLPTSRILDCARALCTKYQANWPFEDLTMKNADGTQAKATVSAGIAVVHYKEDLRFALNSARRAEKEFAKKHGRDALALSVCRRSGEHTTAMLPWGLVPLLQDLVQKIMDEELSDRWTYALRAELPTLRGVDDWMAFRSEALRLAGRAENKSHADWLVRDWVPKFLDHYRQAMIASGRDRSEAQVMDDFVTLCQSASFLARGRDR